MSSVRIASRELVAVPDVRGRSRWRCVERPDLVMLRGGRYRVGAREYGSLTEALRCMADDLDWLPGAGKGAAEWLPSAGPGWAN